MTLWELFSLTATTVFYDAYYFRNKLLTINQYSTSVRRANNDFFKRFQRLVSGKLIKKSVHIILKKIRCHSHLAQQQQQQNGHSSLIRYVFLRYLVEQQKKKKGEWWNIESSVFISYRFFKILRLFLCWIVMLCWWLVVAYTKW